MIQTVSNPAAGCCRYESPVHAGGLIAVSREYFLSLGGYDPGLLVWGGEQVVVLITVWRGR